MTTPCRDGQFSGAWERRAPWLEAMTPRRLLAATTTATGASPLRMGFFYVPNGVHMQHWTPGNDFCLCDLPPILKSSSRSERGC